MKYNSILLYNMYASLHGQQYDFTPISYPKFNIIIQGTYNLLYLNSCFESILEQTYLNYKIIVCCNDNDNDNYLTEYKSHPKITIWKQSSFDKTDGYFNINKSFTKVKDEWIIFLNDYDKFANDTVLDRLRHKMHNHNNIIFWKVKKGDKEIYHKNINKIEKNEDLISGVCFHSKYAIDIGSPSFVYPNNKFLINIQSNITSKSHFIDRVLVEEQQLINIIGLTNINCSISDNMHILSNYMKKIYPGIRIHTIGISEINKDNIQTLSQSNVKDNIFCIQPFEIKNNIYNIFTIIKNLIKKPSALWVWEFKSLPQIFKYYEDYFQKIYVQSQFCYEVFSNHLTIEIEKLPLTSRIHEYIEQLPGYYIQNQGINRIIQETEGKTRIGYCFDVNSSLVRKNPLNLIKAFSTLNNEYNYNNWVLILKYRPARNGHFINYMEEELFNKCIILANSVENIYLINEELDIMDLYKLYTYFDYYISPHCGEGFGITIYDNMILGNKIISTYYSGEKDYLKLDKIIVIKHQEKEIKGLDRHFLYGQMNSYKGAHTSVDDIIKSLQPQCSEYILYFVHLCCTQDFNTGIQKITRTLSTELNKYKKVILVKYCETSNDYILINNNELETFTKYGGVNHLDNKHSFQILQNILNSIKGNKCILVIPEIFHFHQYKLFSKIFQLGIERGYIVSHIFYDDTIYFNKDIDPDERVHFMNEYIKTISLADIVFPISFYSYQRYNFHINRQNILSKQIVTPVLLGTSGNTDINDIHSGKKESIIISNISCTERKNAQNLIKAFTQFNILNKNFRLIIVGNGWKNNIDNINNIEYKNFVTNEELIELYKRCIFSIYSSLREGYGLPIYESLKYGAPVICHNDTSTLEIATNISLPCVSAINCNNINDIVTELIVFANKSYMEEAVNSIKLVNFKTYTEYGRDIYEPIMTQYTA